MSCLSKILVLLVLSVFLVTPAFAIGVLKIEMPVGAAVEEEVEIKVTGALTGDPVEGATVYVNGAEIGKTNAQGVITYVFNTPGIYAIGATKRGYTPAASISLSVRSTLETPETPAPETPETPRIEEYKGLIFRGDLLNEVFEDKIVSIDTDKLKIADVIKGIKKKKPSPPLAFFTDGTNYMALYGNINIENSGYYKVEGYSFGEAEIDGRTWQLFNVKNIEKLSAEEVDVKDLVSNPTSYAGREIIVSGPFREISFELELGSLSSPVSIGSISLTPIDFKEFTRELIDAFQSL